MPVYVALIVVLSAALQGIFGFVVYPIAALLLLGTVLFIKPQSGLGVPALVLAVMAVLSIAGSILCGFSAESLSASMLPLVVLGAVVALSATDEFGRASALAWTCLLSGIMALMGIVALLGFDPLGWHVGKHLVFGFSDSDIAAVWFAACVLVGQRLIGYNRFLALALPLNVAALLLCCSPLITVLFLLAQLAVFVTKRDDSLQMAQMVSVCIAAIFAVALYFAQTLLPLGIVLTIALLAWCWFAEDAARFLAEHKAHWACLGLGIVGTVAGCVFSQRLLVELPQQLNAAFVQMGDGLTCISAHPLWGLGACQWNYLSGFYQSQAYSSVCIPDSFIQLGAEGGVFVLLLALVALVLAGRRMAKGKCFVGPLVTIASLLTPCLASNAAVPALAAVIAAGFVGLENVELLASEEGDAERILMPLGPQVLFPRVVSAVIAAVLCVGCLACTVLQVQQIQFRGAWVSGEVDSADVCSAFASEPYWVQNSPASRIIYDQYFISEVTGSDSVYQSYAVGDEGLGILKTTTQENLYDVAAQAYAYGWRFQFDKGFKILLKAAKKAPRNANIYATMQTYLDYTAVSDELADQAVALGEENGYALTKHELTDDEREQFETAKEEYLEAIPAAKQSSDE